MNRDDLKQRRLEGEELQRSDARLREQLPRAPGSRWCRPIGLPCDGFVLLERDIGRSERTALRMRLDVDTAF